jgi:hypothetical protein
MSATRRRRSSSSSSCNCAIKDHKGGATPGPAPSGGRALSPLRGDFIKPHPMGADSLRVPGMCSGLGVKVPYRT